MSADEVLDIITERLKRRKNERETSASLLWRLGNLISFAVWDAKSYPDLSEAFPNIFEPKNPETDWQIIKARMSKYAEAKRQVRKNT